MASIAACYHRLAQQVDLVVEGIGGWQVPLSRSLMLSDISLRLNLPVVTVVGLRICCINHALLTAAAIAAQGALCGLDCQPCGRPIPLAGGDGGQPAPAHQGATAGRDPVSESAGSGRGSGLFFQRN